jgi:hypothetical protein
MNTRESGGNCEEELSFREHGHDSYSPGRRKRTFAVMASLWANSRLASTLKGVIVRLALREKNGSETVQSLIKRLGLKHA